MNPVSCDPGCCPEQFPVNVPGPTGPTGAAGADGTNGVNAFTYLTADLTVNSSGQAGILAAVADSSMFAIGQPIFISDGTNQGTFQITAKPTSVSLTLTHVPAAGGSTPAFIITGTGTQLVTPGGRPSSLAAALPTALTDNTTGTASNVLAAGVGVFTLAIPITLAQITAAADVLTTYTLGFKFKILTLDCRVTEAATTPGAAVNLNLEINTTDITGGVVALTSANCTPLGAAVAGSAVSGANTGSASDTISVEASSVTAFSEGAVLLLLKVQNLDAADSAASLADHLNDLITALT